MEREVREAGEPAGVDGVDPDGERTTEAVGAYLAEVADMPGSFVQFGAAGEGLLQACPVFLCQGRGAAGDPAVTCRAVGGRGSAPDGVPRKMAMCARTMP